MISIISNMSEIGAGTRGASLGFDALRTASYHIKPDFFKKHPVKHLETENHLLWEPIDTPTAIRIEGIARQYERASQLVTHEIHTGKFPIIITGDHSNGGANIAGIKNAFPDKRLGVVWIDAHADLHSPYTSPSGNVHGMPLATALHIDNEDLQINQPKDKAVVAWKKMKGNNPRLAPTDLVFLGVRDIEDQEAALMRTHNIPNINVEELTKKGVDWAVATTLDNLKNCDIIFVSFDVDSMDPSISRGTGTPVPGGLSREQANGLITGLLASPKVKGFEITEINPLLDDRGNKMGEVAFYLLDQAVTTLQKRL
ncbi:MAG: arginase [Schleiferiaceae bacterium]|nr:arginase [Schleiferiaceae bacterium]